MRRSDWSRFRLSNPATLACFIVRQVPNEAAPLDDLEPEALEGVGQGLTTARTTEKAAASALGQNPARLWAPETFNRRPQLPRLRAWDRPPIMLCAPQPAISPSLDEIPSRRRHRLFALLQVIGRAIPGLLGATTSPISNLPVRAGTLSAD